MILDNFHIRSCYADTDAAGVIHHARYLEFFERSRTEWLERLGAGLPPLTVGGEGGDLRAHADGDVGGVGHSRSLRACARMTTGIDARVED